MYLLVLSESMISAEPIELMMVQAYASNHHDSDIDDDHLRSCHLWRVVDEMVNTGWIVNLTYLILTWKWPGWPHIPKAQPCQCVDGSSESSYSGSGSSGRPPLSSLASSKSARSVSCSQLWSMVLWRGSPYLFYYSWFVAGANPGMAWIDANGTIFYDRSRRFMCVTVWVWKLRLPDPFELFAVTQTSARTWSAILTGLGMLIHALIYGGADRASAC